MPEESFIDYLKRVDSPTLANAIELLSVRPRREGFAPIEVRPLFPSLVAWWVGPSPPKWRR
jgi:hypothetical protein